MALSEGWDVLKKWSISSRMQVHDYSKIMLISHIHVRLLSSVTSFIVSLTFPALSPVLVVLKSIFWKCRTTLGWVVQSQTRLIQD